MYFPYEQTNLTPVDVCIRLLITANLEDLAIIQYITSKYTDLALDIISIPPFILVSTAKKA
jgi:hypothetical protein